MGNTARGVRLGAGAALLCLCFSDVRAGGPSSSRTDALVEARGGVSVTPGWRDLPVEPRPPVLPNHQLEASECRALKGEMAGAGRYHGKGLEACYNSCQVLVFPDYVSVDSRGVAYQIGHFRYSGEPCGK